MSSVKIPDEAVRALEAINEILGNAVLGVYLYGSAVAGGLRNDSDVDILVVVKHRLSQIEREALSKGLLLISGKRSDIDSVRSLEITVVNHEDAVPWKYPPRKEFIYGEWLRAKFERGLISEPEDDPDLAIILYQVRQNSVPLTGPDASAVLDAVPMMDIRRAMKDCLQSLLDWLKGDERNVILTLARIWVTAVTGEILPKDEAAKWAIPRLPQEQADLLDLAGKAYRGDCADSWDGLYCEVSALAFHMKKEIEACLDNGA